MFASESIKFNYVLKSEKYIYLVKPNLNKNCIF